MAWAGQASRVVSDGQLRIGIIIDAVVVVKTAMLCPFALVAVAAALQSPSC